MARPARASAVGGADESSRLFCDVSLACSCARRESCVWRKACGESGLAGGIVASFLFGRTRYGIVSY